MAKILWIGKQFAQAGWETFMKETGTQVLVCTSKNRQEFIQDLKGKYSDITNIGRTFALDQTGRFDEELVSHFPPSLKSVSHCGAGYDQIDVQPLADRGIQLSNITTPVEAPTADTAIYLILATTRNYDEGTKLLRAGAWTPDNKCGGAKYGHLPSSKTVGILGMGGIGRAIRDRLLPFGFKRLIYHNRRPLTPELAKGCDYVGFDELLAKSDVLCISIPLNPHTHHFINHELVTKMKPGVILINTARGAIIDEQLIIPHLRSGHIGFLGTDVFEHEPSVPKELLELNNVVGLPHMGTHTEESMVEMEQFVIDNIKSYLYTGKLMTLVPEMYNVNFDDHKPLLGV